MAPKSIELRWRRRRTSDPVQAKPSALDFASSIGEMGELKRRTPTTQFEQDDRILFKRFRRMLLDDSKKDAVLIVDGERVPVHHEVLAASSPSLAQLGYNILITDSTAEAVRHFVGYLYGFNVLEEGCLTVEEAMELAALFIQFDVGAGAIKAARYCLQKSGPEHLDKFCRVLGNVKAIRAELAEKIAENYDSVDLSLVDTSTLHLVLASLRLTEIQKLIVVGKWMKLNSKEAEMKQLFGTIDLEYAGQAVKEMSERLMQKNRRISALEGKLSTKEQQYETLVVNLKEEKEKINALTIALEENEKAIIELQSSLERELRRLKPASSQRESQDSPEPRQSFKEKPGLRRIMRTHENNTSTTDKTTVKSLSIPPQENGATYSLLKDTKEDVNKDASQMNALGKGTIYARTVPHVYAVFSSSSSEANDPDCGNNVQNEAEGEFCNTRDEIANIEVSKPHGNKSDVPNTTYETAEKEGDGANDWEEFQEKETGPSSTFEPLKSEHARLSVPRSFSNFVSELQRVWEHPSNGQPETLLLHQVRAVMVLTSMTQKSLAKEVGISATVASLYLRGKYRMDLQCIEEKLAVFVRKYLEENGVVNSQIASSNVAAPWIDTELPVTKSPVVAAEKDDGQEN